MSGRAVEPITVSLSMIVMLAAVGLFAGGVGGLIGVGGSIVMIPALTELFGERQHLYQASAMIVNFFVAAPALVQHGRAGAIMGSVVRRMAPVAVGAVGIGVALSELSVFRGGGQAWLMMLFGFLVLVAAARSAARMFQSRSRAADVNAPKASAWAIALGAGAPTGLVGGLLGVGGGVVCVPIQNRLFGVPLRSAIANSAATIVALSVVGAVAKNIVITQVSGWQALITSLTLAGVLIPTAMLGSWTTSRLTHVLPVATVRTALVIFLTVAGARMIFRGMNLLG